MSLSTSFPGAAWRRRIAPLFLALGLWSGLPAQAGRSCDERPPTPQSFTQGLVLAAQVSQRLEASGAQVVVLARAGQDLSKYHLRYSHLGYAYKSPEGPWRVLHKLNQCGTAVSHIERQGLGEFFMDDLWRYEAAWVVPTPEVQAALYPVLQDKARIAPLFEPAYSMVSYAWGQRYQQSNQWALELLAGALEPQIHNRQQAQAWLQFKGYEPTALNIGPLTRLGGRITAANIAFDDHPNEKRFSDRIETVTVDSFFAWLQRAHLGAAPQRIVLPQGL
ncbi:MAG: DUF2145 domain-containing protein [Curvibacter sp.]|nr:DUF2145 domain-containing protein [Curvibacter sp.]